MLYQNFSFASSIVAHQGSEIIIPVGLSAGIDIRELEQIEDLVAVLRSKIEGYQVRMELAKAESF